MNILQIIMIQAMNEKFPYGTDINAYIDKALEKLRYTYPWATKDMMTYSYAIEDVDGEPRFVRYFRLDDGRFQRMVEDCFGDKFIDEVVRLNSDQIERANPVKEVFDIPLPREICFGGDWMLEKYQFRSHNLGGFSTMVQAGNRCTGGNRVFFIPPSLLEGSYEDFLDKYNEMVPGCFGVDKEYLKTLDGLREFLGV